MKRIHDTSNGWVRGPLAVLLLLAALVCLPACGGDDGGKDLPKATVPGGPPPTGTVPGQPTTQPKGLPVPAKKATPPETVVLTVNGVPIRQGEIDQEVNRQLAGMRHHLQPAQLDRYRDQVMPQVERALIGRKLEEAALAADKTPVTDEEVAAQWAELEKRFKQTRAQILARSRMSAEQVETNLRRTLKLRRLVHAFGKPDAVTDEAVKTFYDKNATRFGTPEQVRARHILLKFPDQATEEQKAALKTKLAGLRAEILKKGGDTFAKLAAEHSGCSSGKRSGGDLGLYGRGAMVPEFEKRMFTLEPGVVSEPFATEHGYHIMEVMEKRPAKATPFEEVKTRIREHLENNAEKTAYGRYIEHLRKAAKIERPQP